MLRHGGSGKGELDQVTFQDQPQLLCAMNFLVSLAFRNVLEHIFKGDLEIWSVCNCYYNVTMNLHILFIIVKIRYRWLTVHMENGAMCASGGVIKV